MIDEPSGDWKPRSVQELIASQKEQIPKTNSEAAVLVIGIIIGWLTILVAFGFAFLAGRIF